MKIFKIIARSCDLIATYFIAVIMAIGFYLWKVIKSIFYDLPILAYHLTFDIARQLDDPAAETIEIEL